MSVTKTAAGLQAVAEEGAVRRKESNASEVSKGKHPQLLISALEAAAMCGVSGRTWRRWESAGRAPAPVRVGGTVRWRVDQIHAWVAAGCPPRTS